MERSLGLPSLFSQEVKMQIWKGLNQLAALWRFSYLVPNKIDQKGEDMHILVSN